MERERKGQEKEMEGESKRKHKRESKRENGERKMKEEGRGEKGRRGEERGGEKTDIFHLLAHSPHPEVGLGLSKEPRLYLSLPSK